MKLNFESITEAETPLITKITLAQSRFMSHVDAHLQHFAASEIKKNDHYQDTLDFIAKALESAEPAKSLIYLSSASESMLALGHIHRNENLVTLGKQLRTGIHNQLVANPELFDHYLNVKVESSMSAKQKSDRRLTTGRHYFASSMSAASIADPIIAPFVNDEATRDHLRHANETFSQQSFNVRLPHQVSRFRLNTEHGQSINVFRAEIFKLDAMQEPLYVIAVHGNASCASAEFLYRMMEIDIFLSRSAADRVILLTPDLPGSVASDGYGKSLGEISQNSVQKLVKHLMQQGVDPAQIVVRGHSLGGLISTHAAHTLKTQDIEVSLISVDSLAQTQKFLPKGLAPIAGQLALKHFDSPAYKFFDALAANRRFCIHKAGDSVIPPSCSVMFHLPGNAILGAALQVTRDDCYLISDPTIDHNDDIIQLDYNPCLMAFSRFFNDRSSFQEILFNRFCEKIEKGIQAFNKDIANNTRCIKIGQALMAELPTMIKDLRNSQQPFIERYQIILGWIIHNNNQQLIEYKQEVQKRLIHKDAPFLDFCASIAKFAQSNPFINQLIQNKECKAHCIALYQASLAPHEAAQTSTAEVILV